MNSMPPFLIRKLEHSLSECLAGEVRVLDYQAVAGGSINSCYKLLTNQAQYFLKLNRYDNYAMFEAEAAGLEAIRQSDAILTPEVVTMGRVKNGSGPGEYAYLVLQFFEFQRCSNNGFDNLAAGLVKLHRFSNKNFGFPENNYIGASIQPNHWHSSWVSFWQQQRLGFQIELAKTNELANEVIHKLEKLNESIADFFVAYQVKPSLLHGDLWSGNVAQVRGDVSVIFDPAVYFGDREADIAMTELFGGFDKRFYEVYQALWPLDQAYPVRKKLYNLYHLLNHFNLFGSGYSASLHNDAEFLLSQLG